MSRSTVIANLRHLYAQMLKWPGPCPSAATGLLGPAIGELESMEATPAVNAQLSEFKAEVERLEEAYKSANREARSWERRARRAEDELGRLMARELAKEES